MVTRKELIQGVSLFGVLFLMCRFGSTDWVGGFNDALLVVAALSSFMCWIRVLAMSKKIEKDSN